MKTLSKAFFVTIVACMCLMALSVESKAQCVTCAPAPPDGFICVPSTSGGGGCTTPPGECRLIAPCVPGGDRSSSGNCTPRPLSNPQLSVSDSMIREIGTTDARLALAVRSISMVKAEFTVARISYTPVEYTFDDVENQLTQPADSPYYQKLAARIKDSFAHGGGIVTYEISITEGKGNGSFILSISPAVKGGAAVDIQLQRAVFGEGKNLSEGFKAISYQIR